MFFFIWYIHWKYFWKSFFIFNFSFYVLRTQGFINGVIRQVNMIFYDFTVIISWCVPFNNCKWIFNMNTSDIYDFIWSIFKCLKCCCFQLLMEILFLFKVFFFLFPDSFLPFPEFNFFFICHIFHKFYFNLIIALFWFFLFFV